MIQQVSKSKLESWCATGALVDLITSSPVLITCEPIQESIIQHGKFASHKASYYFEDNYMDGIPVKL